MKHKLITMMASFGLVLGIAGALLPVTQVGAIDVFSGSCSKGGGANNNSSAGTSAVCGAESKDNLQTMIKNVINVLLFLIGIIAVIMIIIGGIRYTTSNGDASSTKGAKDTILYAVVGLVVAIMAFAIVNFVVGAF